MAIGCGIDDDPDDTDEAVFYDVNQRLIHRVVRSRDQDGRVLRVAVHFGGEMPFSHFPGALDKIRVLRSGAADVINPWLPPSGGRTQPTGIFRLKAEATG